MRREQRYWRRGIALVEFSIIVPVLLLMIAGTFEIGRFILQYTILSQIAYEGVRSGIQLAAMSQVCFDDDSPSRSVINYIYSQSFPPSNSSLGHWLAQGRVRTLIWLQGDALSVTDDRVTQQFIPNLDPTYERFPTIKTQFIGAPPTPPEYLAACYNPPFNSHLVNTFGVRIEGVYRPLMIPIDVPIAVEAIGSYLYNNQTYQLFSGIARIPGSGSGG